MRNIVFLFLNHSIGTVFFRGLWSFWSLDEPGPLLPSAILEGRLGCEFHLCAKSVHVNLGAFCKTRRLRYAGSAD